MSGIQRILSQRWPWVTAAGLVVILFVFLSGIVSIRIGSPTPERPLGSVEDIEKLAEREDLNVLFILIDTLRAEKMSVYGYERPTTPFLDRLAREGIVFDKHLSQSSWTKCSMASLWTGLYPSRSGITRFEHVLSEEAELPAETFKKAGYKTTGLYRNGWVEGYFGFSQGFDVYVRPAPQIPDLAIRMSNPTIRVGGTDVDALESAEEFIRIHGRERWFLYVHLMDIHEYLYDQLSAAFGSDHPDIYDNSILRTDMILEEFFAVLEQGGYLDNTIVVIGSDHGEAFNERGLEGHARAVYRETTMVPLIISLPFRLKEGIRVNQPTRNVDIWPTVFDLIGLDSPEYTDGQSQVPTVLAAGRNEAPPIDSGIGFAHLDQTWGMRNRESAPTVAVSEGPYRLIHSARQNAPSVTTQELFNASEDPLELTDLADEEPETTERLKRLALEYLADTPQWDDQPDDLEIDEVQLNQLRALGYSVP